MHLAPELLAAEPRLVGGAGADAFEIPADQREDPEHGKALERQQNMAAGALLHAVKNPQIARQRPLVHHIGRTGHPPGVEIYKITSVHGRPCRFSFSMNGSGSSCSMLNTPAPRQAPVSISMAPIMAGTPVV